MIEKALSIGWFVAKQEPWKLIMALLFLFAISLNFGANYYHGKWLGFGLVFSALIGVEIGKRFGFFAATLVVYLLGNALWFLLYPGNRYAPVQPYELTALKLYIAESSFKLLLILSPFLVYKLDWDAVKTAGRFLCICFTLISTAMIFIEYLRNGCVDTNSCGGVLSNPSMNASMMAVTLPFIFEAFPLTISGPILLAVLGATLLGKSSLGLGLIVTFLCLHFLSRRMVKYLLLSPLLLLLGWYFYGWTELTSSSDRLPMWKFFMSQWSNNPIHWWFGTGFGTFGVFSINLQNGFNFKTQYWWVWLHNDWLEAIFTTGLVGFGLMLLTFLSGLKRFWDMGEKACLQSLLLFGLVMSVNFPLRLGLSCAFGAWLVSLALYREQPHNLTE